MSKRSVRKVRHYAPAPTFKERVLAGKDERDGGQGVRLMDFWRRSVPRYQKEVMTSFVEEEVVEDGEVIDDE
jgi:hypothetical protein